MSWGEIYNTSWWGVALDTARTVKARPDFFGSQLNLLTSEQPNLVVNGSFDTDSDWIAETGWTIANGKANANVTGTQAIYQSGITLNKWYKVTYTISNYVSGDVRLRVGTSSTPTVRSSNGTFTEYLYATGVNQVRISPFTSGFIGSIDNVSVQVVRAELDQIEAKKCLADWIHTTALKDLNN